MATSAELFEQGRTEELWQRYLGFLDLSLEEFMEIQKRKVLEHVAWLSQSELGRKIIGPSAPTTVEQFRERVPLTTYTEYAPYLLERNSQCLPEEPMAWARTSGCGGEYKAKWCPYFREKWEDDMLRHGMAILALGACRFKGDFRVRPGDKLPYMWAPIPFPIGFLAQAIAQEMPVKVMPPEDVAINMTFQERTDAAMRMSFREGMDHFFGLSSVLVKIAERFSESSSEKRPLSKDMLHPKVIGRMLRGIARSKLAGRRLYPKDLWDVKGVLAAGADTPIFAERIERYWGTRPCNFYGTAEFTAIGIQAWDRVGLCPFPDVVFYEFIPQAESLRSKVEPGYQPKTLLMDEVKAGESYELVLTSLKLSPFTRYRVGDVVRIIALQNEACGIRLPQLSVEGRCDDAIDLAGFTRLTERTIWYGIEKSGVEYEEWICRKELERGNPVLHVWIEPKDGDVKVEEARQAIHGALKHLDSDYRDLEEMLGYNPLRMDLLSPGTFKRYMMDRQATGAEPAHFKPRHFVPSEELLDLVLKMDARGR